MPSQIAFNALHPNRRSILKGLGAAAIGISLGGSLSGCGRGKSTGGGRTIKATGEEPRLNFYIWDTYIGENTISDFADASGIDVNMSLFASNDELVAKLRTGNSGFDVIVPANDTVERMIQADMIVPLDHAQIPNLKNIDPAFADPAYDPGRKYSVPYTWLVLGIGYRKSRVNSVPDSWKVLLDSDEYKGRIALHSESSNLFHIGAKYLGHSLNGLSPEITAEIEAMLTRQKKNLKTFHDDNGQDLLLSGEVDLVLEFNGDIAQIMREDDDIGFVVPKEGSELSADTLCIPKGARRPKNAHAFINYLLDAEVGRDIAATIQYPTPNAAARRLMPADYQSNPVIFPPAEVMAKCEYATFDQPRQAAFERSITRIRAA